MNIAQVRWGRQVLVPIYRLLFMSLVKRRARAGSPRIQNTPKIGDSLLKAAKLKANRKRDPVAIALANLELHTCVLRALENGDVEIEYGKRTREELARDIADLEDAYLEAFSVIRQIVPAEDEPPAATPAAEEEVLGNTVATEAEASLIGVFSK